MTSTNGHTSHVAGPASAGSDASPGPATTARALTAREGEVAWMIAAGLSTRRIAAALAVSGRTVEWHVANIQRKLGLQSRLQIALWAVGQSLGAPDGAAPGTMAVVSDVSGIEQPRRSGERA